MTPTSWPRPFYPFVVALTLLTFQGSSTAQAESGLGLDVSHHSGEVDWPQVAKETAHAFVYVKATEGIDDVDPAFDDHWESLGRLNIPRGAYHFYVTEDDPEAQAEFFLSRYTPSPGDLAPVVDIELLGHGTTGDLRPGLRRFLDLVFERVGVRPVIYTSTRFWSAHFDDSFSDHPLWIAEYEVDAPTLPTGWSSWTFWQYEDDGAVPGVEKDADRSRVHPEVYLDTLRIPDASAPPL